MRWPSAAGQGLAERRMVRGELREAVACDFSHRQARACIVLWYHTGNGQSFFLLTGAQRSSWTTQVEPKPTTWAH